MSVTPTKRKRVRDDDVLVEFEKCCKTISCPESWVVERECNGSTEDTWLLLADAKVLTTQKAKERCALLKRRHPKKLLCGLRMSTRGSREVDICTFEQGRVDLGYRDNQKGEIALLYDMLEQVLGNESAPGRTRTGKLLRTPDSQVKSRGLSDQPFKTKIFERHLGKRASIRRREEDHLLSAIYHWKHSVAAKAFNSWKFNLEQRKLGRAEEGKIVVQLGLRNLGNTCYLNAVLQALFSVNAFAQAFTPTETTTPNIETNIIDDKDSTWRVRRKEMLADMDEEEGEGGLNDDKVGSKSLSTEFRELSGMISSHKLVRYTPDGILRLVWRLFGEFRGFKQHDAAEILAHLIDRLEVEEECVVRDMFGYQLCQRISFTQGKGKKAKPQTSSTSISFCGPWAVEIPEQYRQVGRQRKEVLSCSLYDCIAEATAAVTISDYELSDGSRIDSASKQILFDSLPPVLVLHINRTAWAMNQSSQKVHTQVVFPLLLQLGPYRANGASTQYELCSIVSHHGNQMCSGHFTAYGKRMGEWHHFNDAKVTPVEIEEVLEAQPYILIYEFKEIQVKETGRRRSNSRA